MADDSVIIDVTPEPASDQARDQGADDAAKSVGKGEKSTGSSKRPLVIILLVLLFVTAAFGGGVYYAPLVMEQLAINSPARAQQAELARLQTEIDTLRQQMQTKPVETGPQADPQIVARLVALENAPALPESAPVADVSAVNDQMDLLAQQLAETKVALQALDAASSSASLQLDTQVAVQKNLGDRMSALENGLATQNNQLENLSGGSLQGLEDGLLTLSVTRLRQAVNGGGRFAVERQEVEDVIAQREQISFEAVDALRALAAYEDSGVATLETLQVEFAAITAHTPPSPVNVEPVSQTPEGAWWEQIWQSVAGGIRVRKADEAIPASAPADIVDPYEGIAALLTQKQLGEALEQIEALDTDMQTPLASWRQLANQRLGADLAVDVLMTTTRPNVE